MIHLPRSVTLGGLAQQRLQGDMASVFELGADRDLSRHPRI